MPNLSFKNKNLYKKAANQDGDHSENRDRQYSFGTAFKVVSEFDPKPMFGTFQFESPQAIALFAIIARKQARLHLELTRSLKLWRSSSRRYSWAYFLAVLGV